MDELIRILNDLVSRFRKGPPYIENINCLKVTVLKGTDAEKLLSSVIDTNGLDIKKTVIWEEHYTSGEDDVYFVFYPSGIESVQYVFSHITSPVTIGRAVGQLLLDKYELSSMPGSETFIADYPKLAAEDKVPVSNKGWPVVYWYEFLFKLGDERASLICPIKDDAKVPGVKKCCYLGTNVYDASMKALDYLLEKAKRARAETEQKSQAEIMRMTEQERGKPGEDTLSLPPLLPKWDIPLEKGENPEDKRIIDLSLQGFSVAIYAKNQNLTLRQKQNLILAFQNECTVVFGLIEVKIIGYKNIKGNKRLEYFESYQLWLKNFKALVERSVLNNKADNFQFNKMFFSYMELFLKGTLMLSLETDELRQRIAKLKKKLQEQPKAEQPSEPSKEQTWSDNDADYMLLSEAIVTFAGSHLPLPTISKKIKPDGTVRYMRKGQRCMVHIGDFRRFINKDYPSLKLKDEFADEVLANREAMKEKVRLNKKKPGK